ncbi:putative ATPase family AAA domain-containing protein 2 [Apostichopus japonicus]|uniref:Putative ATPase family AAA domain-containing protein 2 n=1 Tax=Stichopus japonicus TaxID=307972 RepID=A0A2G8JVS6_STIJA|nr:putative ATPase family AAA domain-containing protein 2 [Apostichopus japonicus]
MFSSAFSAPSHFRPRLLISGESDQGHSSHVAPAYYTAGRAQFTAWTCQHSMLSVLETQRSLVHRRTAPSIIYMPHIVQWWQASGYTVKATFLTLLQDLPPTSPILLLATADCAAHDIPQEVTDLFTSFREMYNMRNPTSDERREFFTELLLVNAVKPPPKRKQIVQPWQKRVDSEGSVNTEPQSISQFTDHIYGGFHSKNNRPRLSKSFQWPNPNNPELTETEEFKLRESEEATLRELRIFLREVLSRIALERKFRNFAKAVDPEEVPDYFAVIKNPMDLSTMMNKINMHEYTSAKDFLVDIDLITSNALEYNPDQDPSDRQIRNYACELKDMAYAIIDAEMDSDFEQTCVDIATSRIERGGGTNSKDAPSFYRTLPQLQRQQAQEVAKRNPMPNLRITPCSRTLLSPNRTKKKRRRSAWSRGCIPKPKKKEPKLTAGTDGGENDEDREESKEEENGMENGEEEDEEEKVGEDEEEDKEDNSDKDNYRGRDKSSEDVEMGDGQEEEEEEEEEEDGERQNEEEGREDENTEKSNSNQLEKIQSEKTGNWADLNNGIVDDSDDESIKSAPANVKESSQIVDESGDGNSQMNGIDGTPNESSNDGSEKREDETQEDGGEEENTSGIQEQILSLTKPAEIPLRRVTRRMLADHNSPGPWKSWTNQNQI